MNNITIIDIYHIGTLIIAGISTISNAFYMCITSSDNEIIPKETAYEIIFEVIIVGAFMLVSLIPFVS